MSSAYPNDTYWTYLGSRTTIGSGEDAPAVDIDAGLQWSRAYSMYNPYLSIKSQNKYEGIGVIFIAPLSWPIRFDTSYHSWINMCYALQPSGKGSVPMVSFSGWDNRWVDRTVLLAAASPYKFRRGMMKRVHSIAQGKPNYYRFTGSKVEYVMMNSGMLRDENYSWAYWVESMTSETAAYPYPYPFIVDWRTAIGKAYFEEDNIKIDL